MADNTPTDQPSGPFPCDECQAGMMHLRFITYFTWLADELVLVPNFPAWICDVCGRREYDERSISWLSMLLNPDAGKASESRPIPSTRSRHPHHPRPSATS
jgi:YgiT-type zinc finger domain-containing protein